MIAGRGAPCHTDPERHEANLDAVARRTRAGASAAQIAVELRCTARTVQRYRTLLRTAGVDVKRPADMRTHGRAGTYKAGCRCRPCTDAASAYARETLRAGIVRSHGAGGYRRGCKCPTCRAWCSKANAAARQRRRERDRAALA